MTCISKRARFVNGGYVYAYDIGDTYKGYKCKTAVRDEYASKCDTCDFDGKLCSTVACNALQPADDEAVVAADLVWVKQRKKKT
jgi:hypothetical protein